MIEPKPMVLRGRLEAVDPTGTVIGDLEGVEYSLDRDGKPYLWKDSPITITRAGLVAAYRVGGHVQEFGLIMSFLAAGVLVIPAGIE